MITQPSRGVGMSGEERGGEKMKGSMDMRGWRGEARSRERTGEEGKLRSNGEGIGRGS